MWRAIFFISLLAFVLAGCLTPKLRGRIEGYETRLELVDREISGFRSQLDQDPSEALRAELETRLDTLHLEQSRLSGALSEARAEASRQIEDQVAAISGSAGQVVEGLAPIAGLVLPGLAPILGAVGALTRRLAGARS